MKQKFLLLLLTAYSTYTCTGINTGKSSYKTKPKKLTTLDVMDNSMNNFRAFVTSFNTLDGITQMILLKDLLGSEEAAHIMYTSIQNFNRKSQKDQRLWKQKMDRIR